MRNLSSNNQFSNHLISFSSLSDTGFSFHLFCAFHPALILMCIDIVRRDILFISFSSISCLSLYFLPLYVSSINYISLIRLWRKIFLFSLPLRFRAHGYCNFVLRCRDQHIISSRYEVFFLKSERNIENLKRIV